LALQKEDEQTRTRVVEAIRGAFDPFAHGAEVRFTALLADHRHRAVDSTACRLSGRPMWATPWAAGRDRDLPPTTTSRASRCSTRAVHSALRRARPNPAVVPYRWGDWV